MPEMKRSIILTADYEIFGNGSGDVRRHVIGPCERMMHICDRFGVPLTVFFEVEEYLAFEREREKLWDVLGYDPAAEMRTQALGLIRRGHDLQLHLHPEWVGASFNCGCWHLQPEMRSVDGLFDSQERVSHYIRNRKAVIDGFYQEAGSARRVIAFRAGAFFAQPGMKLLAALAENGIRIDSSLVKGMVTQEGPVHLDYSAVPVGRRHWKVALDVACEDHCGRVVEVPIYSRMGRRIQQLTPRRLLAKFSGNVPKAKQREMIGQLGIGRSPASVLRFLSRRFPIKLDFHNMSSGQMLRWIRRVPPPPEGELDVLVLIGHTKEHRDDRDFARFLNEVKADPELQVISMSDLAEMLAADDATLFSREVASCG